MPCANRSVRREVDHSDPNGAYLSTVIPAEPVPACLKRGAGIQGLYRRTPLDVCPLGYSRLRGNDQRESPWDDKRREYMLIESS